MIPGAGDACSVFPLCVISEPSRRQGSGLVEAGVGGFVLCHSMPLCAKPECCDDLWRIPTSPTRLEFRDNKTGPGCDRGFSNPGWPRACRSMSSVFPVGGSAGWAGQECAKLGSYQVLQRDRDTIPRQWPPSPSLRSCSSRLPTPAYDGSTAVGSSDQDGWTDGWIAV